MHKMTITLALAEVDRDFDDIMVTCTEADCWYGPFICLDMDEARRSARAHRSATCDHSMNATQIEGILWECDDCGAEFNHATNQRPTFEGEAR